ncbi:MAG TPA: signal peptidase I [Solirubrobacteraceae bacterium]|nr:signal peptidase I [Solirubrobacteraceae bacterium]
MKRARSFIELILTVLVAAGLAFLVQAFVVKPYRIPSGSMIPTLDINQRILVNRLATHPGLGTIVVFHPPRGADLGSGQCANPAQGFNAEGSPQAQPCDAALSGTSPETFVKRVVGLPGDTLRIVDGHVFRNGVREQDSYIAACGGSSECTFARPIKVPAGDYYMMGDNRGNSDDSRYWGPVPQKDIIGEAFFTYWPISRIGTL